MADAMEMWPSIHPQGVPASEALLLFSSEEQKERFYGNENEGIVLTCLKKVNILVK